LVGQQRVDKCVAELRVAPPDDFAPAERDEQDPADRQERGRLEGKDALRRRRVDCDARRSQSAVEQHLDEETAERGPDQDRWLVERAHDPLVMIDDLTNAQTGKWPWIASDLFDRPVLAGPGRCQAPVAARLEEGDKRLPAGWRDPAAMDENDGATHLNPPV